MIYLNFVGEGRSGHTILSGAIGSRLDTKIAEEQKYISKWRRGQTKEEILSALMSAGAGSTRRGQGWPNLTTFNTLRVIGDKAGWDAVNEFNKRGAPKTIINDFGAFMAMPVKTIVTVRHPLDNITAWVDSPKYKRMFSDDHLRFRRMIRRYKRFYTAAAIILEGTDYRVVPHESLCADPNGMLQSLADWLELPNDKAWRREAGGRIHSSPHLRRDDVNWPEGYFEERLVPFIAENPLMETYRG